MAYLMCSFERLLIFYECEKENWCWILERLWRYTDIQYLDDWMYEIAEFLPDNVLEDGFESFEYISEKEYVRLREIYGKNNKEINQMMNIIFDLGTMELYSKLINNSHGTLLKLKEAIDILDANGIERVDRECFLQYQFSQCSGWGECFDGKRLSVFL